MGLFYWNPTYWLFVGPALLFMLFAQWRISSSYRRWGQVRNARGIPGAVAAEQLLAQNGMSGVRIQGISGRLSDHYDPQSNTLSLSEDVARQASVASLAIVAHEIGHAQQDAQGSLLMKVRGGLVPAVNFGSSLGPILFIIGYFLQFTTLMWLGIAFFSMAFVFALLTLPLEIDASARALRMLKTSGLLEEGQEMHGARSVLGAAALTYVAALLTALTQLLYYMTLASGRRRRR
jgi:Zn-dependent membrane protease YugP